MTIEQTYDRMALAMTAVTGEPFQLTRTRGTDAQCWRRRVIVQALHDAGWSDQRIGDCIGRNHSSITIARHRLQEALSLPRIYPDVVRLQDSFKTKYHELFGQDI